MSEPKTKKRHIEKAIKDIENFNDIAQLYLIKKSKSKKLEKRLELKRIEIKTDEKFFKSVINKKLQLIKSKIKSTGSLKYFFDEDYDDEDLLELESKKIVPFAHFLEKLDRPDEIKKISELQEDEDFDSFAVDFDINECRIVWFRNLSRNKLILSKDKSIFSFTNNEFKAITDTTFYFDHDTDAIYFESTDSVIVCNKIPFERIFDFYEYYQGIATAELEEIDGHLITLSNDMDNVDGKVKLSKDIADIKEKGGFPSIEKYKEYEKIFKELKNQGHNLKEKYTTINIVDDKLTISTEVQRETLISIARSDILQEPTSGEYYKSLQKQSLYQ